MFLRLIVLILISVWLVLVVLGKGGFIHLLLLTGIGVAMVEIISVYRRRMPERSDLAPDDPLNIV